MKTRSKTLAVTRLTTVCDPLELARLIEEDLAHWRDCQQWPCTECEFIKKIFALAGNMIFSERTWAVESLREPPNGRSRSRPIKLTPAAKLDAIARSNSHWLPVIAEIIDCAYKSAEGVTTPPLHPRATR